VLDPHLSLHLGSARRGRLNGGRMLPTQLLQDPGSLRPANE